MKGDVEIMEDNKTIVKLSISDVAELTYINGENARFEEREGFTALFTNINGEEKEYKRVFLHRAFPHEAPEEFISVSDAESNEIGIIKSLDDFASEQRELLERELERKYFLFEITRILSVNEKFGFSYWKVNTPMGEREFTLRDTYRSITRITNDRIFAQDVDGNRWHITSLAALDRKSRKRIELYL